MLRVRWGCLVVVLSACGGGAETMGDEDGTGGGSGLPCPEPADGEAVELFGVDWNNESVNDFLVLEEGIYFGVARSEGVSLEFLAFDDCDRSRTLHEYDPEGPTSGGRLGFGPSDVYWTLSELTPPETGGALVARVERGGGAASTYPCPFEHCRMLGIGEIDGRVYWHTGGSMGELLDNGTFELLEESTGGCWVHSTISSDGEDVFALLGNDSVCEIRRLPDLEVVAETDRVFDLVVADGVYWSTTHDVNHVPAGGSGMVTSFEPNREFRSFGTDGQRIYAAAYDYNGPSVLVATSLDGSQIETLDSPVLALIAREEGGLAVSSVQVHDGYVYYWKHAGDRQALFRRRVLPP